VTLSRIIDAFEGDNGYIYSPEEREEIDRMWNSATPDQRAFLEGLSTEDLESICVGEQRGGTDATVTCFYGGKWQSLPAGVNGLLARIFDL
jgi:hypothetical protein